MPREERSSALLALERVVAELGLESLTPELPLDGRVLAGAHVSDLLSDVLAHAPHGGVLVTIQVHLNVIAVAVQRNLAAVIFVSGMRPAEPVRRRAVEEGIPVFLSKEGAFDVAGRLYALGLRGNGR